MGNFNALDCILLVICFFSMLSGLNRGLIREVISFAALIIACIIASHFASRLANLIMHLSFVERFSQATASVAQPGAISSVLYMALGISFLIIFSLTMLAGTIVSSLMTTIVIYSGAALSTGNRLLGAIFGLGRGCLTLIILLFLLQLTPIKNQSWWNHSQFVATLQPIVTWFSNWVSPIFFGLKTKLEPTLQEIAQPIHQATEKIAH